MCVCVCECDHEKKQNIFFDYLAPFAWKPPKKSTSSSHTAIFQTSLTRNAFKWNIKGDRAQHDIRIEMLQLQLNRASTVRSIFVPFIIRIKLHFNDWAWADPIYVCCSARSLSAKRMRQYHKYMKGKKCESHICLNFSMFIFLASCNHSLIHIPFSLWHRPKLSVLWFYVVIWSTCDYHDFNISQACA